MKAVLEDELAGLRQVQFFMVDATEYPATKEAVTVLNARLEQAGLPMSAIGGTVVVMVPESHGQHKDTKEEVFSMRLEIRSLGLLHTGHWAYTTTWRGRTVVYHGGTMHDHAQSAATGSACEELIEAWKKANPGK